MIKDTINKLIMEAMKAGDKLKTEAYRSVKTAFMNWETAKENVGKVLDEATEMSIIRKLAIQYEDTATQCNDGKHDELVKESLDTATILKDLLPQAASKEDIENAFVKICTESDIEPIKKNMGRFIGLIKTALPNADGGMVANVVKERLN